MERTKYPGIYRRGEGSVGVVSYRDGFGRKRQKWTSAPNLQAARDARRNLLNELEKGIRPDASRMTVEEFALEVWIPDCAGRLRALTVSDRRRLLGNHIFPAIGKLKLREVDRQHLRRLYATLTPATAANVNAALSAMFTFAIKDEAVLAVNPCATMRRPRYKPPEARHLDPAEAKRLLKAAVGSPLEGGIILGLAGGLRVAEAVAVRWGDVEEDGTVTVRRSWWGETKSGRIRSLTLPASALGALRRFKRAQAEQLLAIGIRQGPDAAVVTDLVGRALPLPAFKDRFRAFCREHGFDVTFHGLRHSNAVAMLTAGVDSKTAASRLGHSNPALLWRTYSHYIRSADKAAAERLERMLSG